MPPRRAQSKTAPAPFPLASLEVAPVSPAKRKRSVNQAPDAASPVKSRPAGAAAATAELTRRRRAIRQEVSSPSRTPSRSGSSRTPLTSPTPSPPPISFSQNALAGSSRTLVPSQEIPRIKLGSEASDDDDDDHLQDGGFELSVKAAMKGASPIKQRVDAMENATRARAERMLDDAGLGAKRPKEAWKPSRLPVGVELGNACLVRSTNGHYLYGRLLDFKAAESQGGSDLYTVETIDKSSKGGAPLKLKRGRILFTCDKEIADCKIMETTYTVPTFTSDANTRPLTPPPEAELIAPARGRRRSKPVAVKASQPDGEPFGELSQRDQLYRIRPHLQCIINDEYAPSTPRLDIFYAGRYDSVRKMAKYGDIRENEAINVYGAEIRRWALRAERWGAENKPSGVENEPPRPTGSARYEKLTPQQRQSFVIDVLVPEAIAEICKLSYDLALEYEDEQEAYDAAIAKLNSLRTKDSDTKWQMVADAIYSARRQQRRSQGLKEENESEHVKALRIQKEFDQAIERGEITISGAADGVRLRKRTSYRV